MQNRNLGTLLELLHHVFCNDNARIVVVRSDDRLNEVNIGDRGIEVDDRDTFPLAGLERGFYAGGVHRGDEQRVDAGSQQVADLVVHTGLVVLAVDSDDLNVVHRIGDRFDAVKHCEPERVVHRGGRIADGDFVTVGCRGGLCRCSLARSGRSRARCRSSRRSRCRRTAAAGQCGCACQCHCQQDAAELFDFHCTSS